MDATNIEEIQKKVNPVTVAFIVIMLAVGFILGRLSYKLEAQDQKFHEAIMEIRLEIDYFNSRVDRKMENHEKAYHEND